MRSGGEGMRMAAIWHLMRLEYTRPFILAWLESGGDRTPLLAMCDWIEEYLDETYYRLAHALRASFTRE